MYHIIGGWGERIEPQGRCIVYCLRNCFEVLRLTGTITGASALSQTSSPFSVSLLLDITPSGALVVVIIVVVVIVIAPLDLWDRNKGRLGRCRSSRLRWRYLSASTKRVIAQQFARRYRTWYWASYTVYVLACDSE
jgi:hypothetical protein